MENFLREKSAFQYMPSNMGVFQDIRSKFKSLIGPDRTFKSVNNMASETGIEQKSLKRFLDGQGGLTLENAARAFDWLGVKIVFPGDKIASPSSSLQSKEAQRIDELILGMRAMGMRPESIRDGVIREIEAMFQKNDPEAEDEERRQVG